jgi:hypothetical protein
MSAGLAKWSEAPFPDFYPQTLFEQRVDGEDIEFNVLPIPRDMEMTWYEWPDDIAKLIDHEKFLLGLGDRLGDAWEEKYTKEGDWSHSEYEKIFPTIYDLKPHYDNTMEYKHFYADPVGGCDNVGDGFRNLEKYRGFYGIMHYVHSQDTIAPDTIISLKEPIISFERLSPSFRNMFVMLDTDDELLLDTSFVRFDTSYVWEPDTTEPDTSDTDSVQVPVIEDKTLYSLKEYLSQDTLGSFYNIRQNRMYVHQLAKNDRNHKYYEYQPHSIFVEFIGLNVIGRQAQKRFANGVYSLNTRCDQLKYQQNLVSLWCKNYYDYEEDHYKRFSKRFNGWNTNNVNDIPELNDDISNIAGILVSLEGNIENHIPLQMSTYVTYIQVH